jgi:hypothetical protein
MKKWTKDEEDFLKACCERGWFYKDVANELNRGLDSIKCKAYQLSITTGNKCKKKTTEQYKKELKEKCPTIICLEEYLGHTIHILHKCLKCDVEYNSTPSDKLAGHGCKNCGLGGDIPLNEKGIIYLVYIPKYDLYKIGITAKTTQERMRDNRISKYELVLEHTFSKGIDAMKLEKVWKENLKEYLVNTGVLRSGNTETFRI